jgi:hypothetical protein
MSLVRGEDFQSLQDWAETLGVTVGDYQVYDDLIVRAVEISGIGMSLDRALWVLGQVLSAGDLEYAAASVVVDEPGDGVLRYRFRGAVNGASVGR